MAPAIKIENLSKQYKLGLTHAGSIRELVNGTVGRLFRRRHDAQTPKVDPNRLGDDGQFWALRDVSFEIHLGEVVGIIGRNGAGKSTLLKILSRVTAPTSGRVEMRGRVASLLEVGTGFHPELTGRENVYMNGTILGMTKREIDAQFDAIVDFSGVENFIDTPVKRYSSGMNVRLGFAVAAHLEPETLIVDEVLAVGDASFQKKCLTKLEEMTHSGRTIVLVSHQMNVIQTIADRCVLLDGGKVVSLGPTHQVLADYLQTGAAAMTPSELIGNVHWQVKINDELSPSTMIRGQSIHVQISCQFFKLTDLVEIAFAISNGHGVVVGSSLWSDSNPPLPPLIGTQEWHVRIPTDDLRPGPYWMNIIFSRNNGEFIASSGDLPLPSILPIDGRNQVVESRRGGATEVRARWRLQT